LTEELHHIGLIAIDNQITAATGNQNIASNHGNNNQFVSSSQGISGKKSFESGRKHVAITALFLGFKKPQSRGCGEACILGFQALLFAAQKRSLTRFFF
jgi:hypothetical protein